jgi:hypothetical protein
MTMFQMGTSYSEFFAMPYTFMTKAMAMAQNNMETALDANRALTEAVQTNLRKQQEVALELTQTMMRSYTGAMRSAAKLEDAASAANSPFEFGQKMLDAQLNTLRSFGLANGKGFKGDELPS